MFFYTIVVAFNASRSPTDAAVIFAYFSILCRIITVFGWYFHKKLVYMAGGAGEAVINISLFFMTITYDP